MAYTDSSFVYTQTLTADDTRQLVDILTPFYDGDTPFRRKDAGCLTLTGSTGGDLMDVYIYTDNVDSSNYTVPIYIGSFQADFPQEVAFDISEFLGVCKKFQIRMIGLVADFNLSRVVIDYSLRPEQSTYMKVNLMDLGIISPNKKRIRVWPISIDVLDGELANIVPYIDGVAQPVLVIQNAVDDYPQTVFYHFTTDVLGIDYALSIHGCCAFEVYKVFQPVGVQILPIAKRFDQVGPEHFFKYGKVKSLLIRILPFGVAIPYTVYFQDAVKLSGTLTVVSGVEDVYEIGIPKGVSGQVTRIELGPTLFDFHRYYVQAQVAKSGRDTELEWVPLTDNFQGGQE